MKFLRASHTRLAVVAAVVAVAAVAAVTWRTLTPSDPVSDVTAPSVPGYVPETTVTVPGTVDAVAELHGGATQALLQQDRIVTVDSLQQAAARDLGERRGVSVAVTYRDGEPVALVYVEDNGECTKVEVTRNRVDGVRLTPSMPCRPDVHDTAGDATVAEAVIAAASEVLQDLPAGQPRRVYVDALSQRLPGVVIVTGPGVYDSELSLHVTDQSVAVAVTDGEQCRWLRIDTAGDVTGGVVDRPVTGCDAADMP